MKKNQWLLLIVVVLVAVLGYWLMGGGGKLAGDFFASPTGSPSPSPTAKAYKPGASATPVATPSKPYSDLVKEYEGRRVQFDERCQAVPNSVVFKNGTSIMLDNRSSSAKTIKVGDKSYNLLGYGYQVINLSSSSLPKELSVSCGSSGNVGKILLQAQLY